MSLLKTLQRVGAQTVTASTPAAFLYGRVVSVFPLSIQVNSRFTLPEELLVVVRELHGGAWDTHAHLVPRHQTQLMGEHTHEQPAHTTQSIQGHQHNVAAGQSAPQGRHAHPLDAQVTATEYHTGLAVGDSVVLLRNHGGQQYLVLGRL